MGPPVATEKWDCSCRFSMGGPPRAKQFIKAPGARHKWEGGHEPFNKWAPKVRAVNTDTGCHTQMGGRSRAI